MGAGQIFNHSLQSSLWFGEFFLDGRVCGLYCTSLEMVFLQVEEERDKWEGGSSTTHWLETFTT